MRILHPSQVGFHHQQQLQQQQQQFNNINTTGGLNSTTGITGTTGETITNSNLIIKTKRSDLITGHLTTTTGSALAEDYTITDLSNLNGNSELPEEKYSTTTTTGTIKASYGLIDTDDNINLTISSSHNQPSVRYSRNQNQNNFHQVNHHLVDNSTSTTTTISNNRIQSDPNDGDEDVDAEVVLLCNNLNQLNNFKSNSNAKHHQHEQRFNGNGNDNRRQIFEGNLNVLEIEQETSPKKHLISSGEQPSTISRLGNNITSGTEGTLSNLNSKSISKNISESEQEEDEDEEDEDDEDEEDEDDYEEEENEYEELENSNRKNLICNEYHHINHLNRIATPITQQEEIAVVVRNKISTTTNTNFSEEKKHFLSNNFEDINLSLPKLKQNLAKLDLETNPQNSFHHHNHQQQQHQQHRLHNQQEQQEQKQEQHNFGNKQQNQLIHTPHKRSDNISVLNSIDCQSRGKSGRVSGYSSSYSCETSPDDSFMEDEDAYSPSPSSSTSLTSPEPSNFPRGIINPNYPGFQHLAHTLSEHFVNHSDDADDSDLSEFEVELSVESLDESFEHHFQSSNSSDCYGSNNNNTSSINNNNNSNNNNNNNNNDAGTSESLLQQQQDDANDDERMLPNDELNYNLETEVSKESREHKIICLPEIQESSTSLKDVAVNEANIDAVTGDVGDKNKIPNREGDEENNPPDTDSETSSKILEQTDDNADDDDDNDDGVDADDEEEIRKRINEKDSLDFSIVTEDISCDLDTYLKKYETSTDAKTKEKIYLDNNKSIDIKQDEITAAAAAVAVAVAARNCPTPDILIKNNGKMHFTQKSSENQPDLLKNVGNVCLETLCNFEDQDQNRDQDHHHQEQKQHSLCTTSLSSSLSPISLAVEEKKINRILVPDNIPIETKRSSENRPDDSSYGVTPVDIIGDFGREVEREFGLIVSGYNTRMVCHDYSSPTSNYSNDKKLLIKTADAVLSDAKEQLSVVAANSISSVGGSTSERNPVQIVAATAVVASKASENRHTTIIPKTSIDRTTCDLLLQTTTILSSSSSSSSSSPSTESSTTGEDHNSFHQKIQGEHQSNSLQDHKDQRSSSSSSSSSSTTSIDQKNHKDDGSSTVTTMTITSSSKVITKNFVTSSSNSNNSAPSIGYVEKLIPTAIVKPKYQKPSYDDRQLPPIGLGFCGDYNRPWYESKSSNSTNNTVIQSNAASSSSSSGTSGIDLHSQRSRKIQHHHQQQNFPSTHNFDRNSKFSSKKLISRSSTGSSMMNTSSPSSSSSSSSSVRMLNNKLPPSRRFNDKDNSDGNKISSSSSSTSVVNSSVVAVVTPRKKDKMETINISNGGGEKKYKNIMEKNNNNNSSSFTNNNNNINNNNNNNSNCSVDVKKREYISGGGGGSCDKKKNISPAQPISANFDVYNIETALPVIDLEAIENHLRKAKEEERKRRNDREEIRRRLAMGAEDDYFSKIVSADRPGRKPSLQSRLQSGMNLQICFMNEASSDTESPSSDSETCPKLSKATTHNNSNSNSNLSRYNSLSAHPYNSRPLSVSINGNNNNNNRNNNKSNNRPSTLSLGPPPPLSLSADDDSLESDFFTKQARLQIEARMALAQAKDMAHMQMEIERQKQKQSPITEVIRSSLEKVGVPFPPEKRRVSRQMLTDMNIAQLQIIVNELHTQIERLNEQLVQFLMERDELHMSQDSMLVDIEDLTRYLGAKEQSKTNEKVSNHNTITTNNNSSSRGGTQQHHQQQQQQQQKQQQQRGTSPTKTATMATTGVTVATTVTPTSTTTVQATNNQQSQSKFQRIASLVKK